MQREPLAIRAKGRWRGILAALGVDDRFLTGRHGPCPMCGGKDRWRFSDRDGTGSWICTSCQHGDGAELVKRLKGIPFAEAAKLIEEVIGEAKAEEPRKRLTDAQAKARMRALWASGKRLTRDSFAGAYLASRGILCDPCPTALRICQSPLMLMGKVISPDGKAVNVHRTFLTADGRKADRAKVRMLMEGITPAGSAIRLGSPLDRLGVAEGIENALSASTLAPDPCWATWSADSLAAFLAPAGIKHLTIWADNDENYHGQWAAMNCARANIARGLQVDVKIPERVGNDWNDVLMSGAAL